MSAPLAARLPVRLGDMPNVVAPPRDFLDPKRAPYGLDISTLPDLDASMRLVGGDRALQEALLRRLITPRGSLDFHPDYGLDVRALLNGKLDEDDIAALRGSIENQLEQDERVTSISVDTEWDADTKTLTLDVAGTTGEGPFTFTAELTALGNAQV